MTTSTDKTPKKKKAKGPIRFEAVIPALILTLLVGGYFKIFFDGHVRRLMEYVGTQVNGAEVKVSQQLANQLVDRYVLNRPLKDSWSLAVSIVGACIRGYDPPKKAGPAGRPAKRTKKAG